MIASLMMISLLLLLRVPLGTARLYSHTRTAPLQKERVSPYTVQAADALAPTHQAEAACVMQAQAGLVLREDARLQRPDARRLGRLDQRGEQRPAQPAPARSPGDVHADLRYPGIDLAPGNRAQGRPAGNLAAEHGYQPAIGPVRRVPRLPVRHRRFERGVARRDAFRVDRAHLRPVRRQHRAEAHTGHAGSLALLHRSLLRKPKSLSRSRTREAPVVPPCLRHARSPGNCLHSEGTGPARPIPRALITVRSPARASSPVRVFARATRWPIRHPRMYRLHSHRRLSEHRLGAYYSRSQSF